MPTDATSHSLGLLIAYSAAVILASVAGGILPEWIRLTHTRMQLMISFVGGVMLGIAIFHMIPHALVALPSGSINQVMWGVMLGLIATFFLLRFSHFHQHGPADFGILAEEQRTESHDAASTEATHLCSEHNHPSASGHDHGADGHEGHRHSGVLHESCQHSQPGGGMRWMAVLVGLGLHTLMDGVAMASGIAADSSHDHSVVLPGLGIFLAVLLHKPLDAVSITSLMHPVTTPTKRLVVNVGFALMCPLGAFLFWGGASLDNSWSAHFAGWGLAFSAGVFLCISLSDLLPEMEFHSHSRIPLSIALLAGILAAWSIGLLEGEHAHQLEGGAETTAGEHSHSHETGADSHGHEH